jgi:hypothetical protein
MIFGATTHKIKIYLRWNAFVSQSYATVKRWNGEEWKTVETMSGVVMSGCIKKHPLKRAPGVTPSYQSDWTDIQAPFLEVEKVLIQKTEYILGG